ncbi:MAG TPA: FAD-dependent oxidoreductase, partial [Pseudonocardiaceae bacterium]|nr:FAD-dependent oxidoreductase [Pseudonocardiaceae bacterium]
MTPELDVAVVGAGVAGLSLAHTLRKAGLEVRVFEAAGQVGGRMRTRREDGYLIDEGAETVPPRGNPATRSLIRELGIGECEVPRIAASLALWRDGRVHHHLGRPAAVVTGAGLSVRGRWELARFSAWAARRRRYFDLEHPERTPLGEMTVADLAGRFGRELHDYLFAPITSGFFGWHPESSAAAPFVSLLLSAGDPAGWRTYREGMDTLARRLAERVEVTTGFVAREVISGSGLARVVADDATIVARH